MKNIGIFTHDLYPFKPWGQGRYVFDLVNQIRPRCKSNIYVFSPSDDIEDELHIRIFPGSHESIGKNISFSIKLALIIEKLIKKYNLGLIHFQGGPGGLFLLKKPSVPIIYTVHHTFFQQSRYISSQKWKNLLFLWEKHSYQKTDYLICDSDSSRKIIEKHYNISPKHCSTIQIGVDRQKFCNVNIAKIPMSILFLGRLDKRKGIDFLLKSMPQITKKCPDIHLYIIGKGILEQELVKYVENQGLSNNVTFLGTVKDHEITPWYNKVSAIIIPSVFEGFGLTATEAMACGTPIIATDVDALRDIVHDGINGKLVKYGDIEGMSNAVTSLLKSPQLQDEFAKKGRMMASDTFNWDNISKQVISIYNQFLCSPKDYE